MKQKVILSILILAAVGVGARADEQSPWERRFNQESEWRREGLALVPYRLNYFLPLTYNTSPHATSTHSAQNKEAKFQISLKVLLADELFDRDAHLYFGYTQLALWQAYDRAQSSPFREIDYEPEAILTLDSQKHFGETVLRKTDIGITHQSNGVSDPDSRSWNRVYARFNFDRERFAFSIRPWYRIPDSPSQDDNKDINKYMGYGDIEAAYYFKNHVISLLFRNNLRLDGNKGALELDYTFPLTRILTGLLQWFNGYGETLIDYNHPVNRFSIGIALSPWQ